MPYQPPGVEGSLLGNPVLSEGELRIECVTSLRQSRSNSIFEPHERGILTPLCCLALEIWERCVAREIMIRAEYLPGVENVATDWESRHYNSSNWQLSPAVFDAMNQLLGFSP